MNKKGYINDVITGTAMLLGFFVVLVICLFILFQWNSAIQNSSAVTQEVKEQQQDFTDTYPIMIGWLFPILWISLMLYTIITAYLIDIINKVWFIIGFIVAIFQGIVSYVVSQVYENIANLSIFTTQVSLIPGAELYFSNVILFNGIWAFLVLLALYFKVEG